MEVGVELKHLRHFVAVVEAGTLSAASETLNLTQPALTRSIKNLEHYVRADLLERKSRGVEPTEAGAQLYDHAKAILNDTAKAARDVAALAAGRRGKLTFGIAPLFASHLTHDLILQLRSRLPDLELEVRAGLVQDLMEQLRTGALDAVLSNLPSAPLPEELSAEPLLKISAVFVVGADHPLARAPEVSHAELAQYDWAAVTNQDLADALSGFFHDRDLAPIRPKVGSNSLTLLRTLVLSGAYISALPAHLVADHVALGEMVILPVAGTPLVRDAGVLTRPRGLQRPPVMHFLRIVRELSKTWPQLETANAHE